MSWTDEKVDKLKELWGKGNTASQIAEIIGGVSRNAVIGKAHRLNLSAKIKTRSANAHQSSKIYQEKNKFKSGRGKRSKFKSLIIEKDFEPENPKQLEELDDNSCKWPIGHPDEKTFHIVNFICFTLINQKERKKIQVIKKIFKNISKRKYKRDN